MIAPPIPKNETERLNDLIETNILDSPRESDYDNLTLLAASIFEVPISTITLVDKNRQWFKSCIGLPKGITETPRNVSFCSHAIIAPSEVLVVPDARFDERFFDNPMVVGESKFIFYAGAPLLSVNGNVLGTLCIIDNKPREFSEHQVKILRTLANQISKLIELRLSNDRLARGLIEKSVLLKEIHHRVKNNLQLVSSLLKLQANVYDNEEFSQIIKTSQDRIKSMSLVHEKLYLSKSLSKIDIKEYISALLKIKSSEIILGNHEINYKINIPDVQLKIEKILPIGLIINELFTNSVKHALNENNECLIVVELINKQENKFTLLFSDNGNGLSSDLDKDLLPKNKNGIGMELVDSFVNQLDGSMDIDSTKNGLSFKIEFEV